MKKNKGIIFEGEEDIVLEKDWLTDNEKIRYLFGRYFPGLPRKCPACNVIAHYQVKSREEEIVECKFCGNNFPIKKHRKERPKAKIIKNEKI